MPRCLRSDNIKNTLKLIGKIALYALCGILALVILVIGGLNIAKFAIYGEYFSIKDNICRNPGLSDGFVCQGIAAYDQGDVILVSGYMKDHSASRIYVTTLNNKSYYVTMTSEGKEFNGHAGGIAVTGGKIYLANGNKVYTFSAEDVINAKNSDSVEIGKGIVVNNKASFIYTDDQFIYVGEFHDGGAYNIGGHENTTAEGTHYAICSKYALSDLEHPVAVYSIRNKVQGICFTPDGKVVMSTSYGLTSSVYYVYNVGEATDSGLTMDGAPLYYLDKLDRKFTGPAMSEGLDYFDGKVITLAESASDKYIFGKLFFANKIVGFDLTK